MRDKLGNLLGYAGLAIWGYVVFGIIMLPISGVMILSGYPEAEVPCPFCVISDFLPNHFPLK